jgi:DNA-binding CsgD family transcriptional regulator/PAS domain-containing protein
MHVTKEGQLDTLIHTLYETALDSGRWASALEQLASYLDAAASHLIVWNKPMLAVSFLTGIPPDADGSYGTYYASIDPFRQLAMAQSPGEWLRCHEHFDENFVRRNEFYQDHLAPYGLRYLLGGKLVESNGRSALVTLLRGAGQPPFSESDVASVRRIEGHLRRAVRLHLTASDLRAHAQMSASALDSLSCAVWIVTPEGALRHLNTRAEAILQASDGLVTIQGHLRALNEAHAHLARMIKAAAQPNGTSRGGALFIERPNGKPPYQVFVVALPEKSAFAVERQVPLALVLTKDATQRVAAPPLFAQLYGLTPAEGRLAAALLTGKTPGEHATAAAVSIATVRTQLHAVLAKTGTRRQVELVCLLANIPHLHGD